MRRACPLPDEVEKMHSRQRDLMRVIYLNGGATVREIHERIPDPPKSICGIRTLLNRLVRKGFLRARPSGRHSEVVYLPARSDATVQLRAFERLAKEHFGGSKARAIRLLARLAAEEYGIENNAFTGTPPDSRLH